MQRSTKPAPLSGSVSLFVVGGMDTAVDLNSNLLKTIADKYLL